MWLCSPDCRGYTNMLPSRVSNSSAEGDITQRTSLERLAARSVTGSSTSACQTKFGGKEENSSSNPASVLATCRMPFTTTHHALNFSVHRLVNDNLLVHLWWNVRGLVSCFIQFHDSSTQNLLRCSMNWKIPSWEATAAVLQWLGGRQPAEGPAVSWYF